MSKTHRDRFRNSSLSFCIILSVLILLPHYASGQNKQSSNELANIGLSIDYSPDSFRGWGKIKNSHSFSLKGQFWFSKLQIMGIKPRIGSEIIISQHLNYPVNGSDGPRDQRFGVGLTPIKVLTPIGTSTIKPFTVISGGLVFLNDRLPADGGASLNYLLNIGAGIEFPLLVHTFLQVGYSLQHLSNGNSANLNPGIDYHNIFITVVI